MHAAPPVRISLTPDRAWRAAPSVMAGVASANLAAWLAALAELSVPVTAGLALLAAALAVAVGGSFPQRHASTAGVLGFDGAVWQWSGTDSTPLVGTVRVTIDLGAWLLLRFEPGTPPRRAIWLAASRRAAGTLWPAWRAALYSRPPGERQRVPAGSP
jgi:hypothetical protein